ncbi:MAG: sugar ABC transporter ATP-binding protein [Burkholderiales bacterium]|nr:sugar ABC transporter ATP-binding protein [Anaerolineae bacterium]
MGGSIVHFESIGDAINQGVGVVRQELDLVPELSLAENIFLGSESTFTHMGFVDRKAMVQAARPLLERMGLNYEPSTKLRVLSIGDRQLVAASRALRNAARVLLLDEPTSSLTPWEAERLFAQVRTLAESGVAIIYISHRVDEVTALCNRVVVLRDGAAVGEFKSPPAEQAQIIDTMAPGGHTIASDDNRTPGAVLLEAQAIQVGKHGPASFQLRAGEIVGFFGLIGAGRTTLARALVGDLPLDSGQILFKGQSIHIASPYHGYQVGVAYLSEDRKRESILPGMNLRSNITVRAPQDTASMGVLNQGNMRRLTNALIQKLGVLPPNQETQIESLSGGNQQKVVLGRLLADSLDVLVLDEPTHGIDVAAKRDLLALLRELAEQGKAIAFISSELPELLNVADRVLVMRRGQVVGEFRPKDATERDVMGAAAGEGRAR